MSRPADESASRRDDLIAQALADTPQLPRYQISTPSLFWLRRYSCTPEPCNLRLRTHTLRARPFADFSLSWLPSGADKHLLRTAGRADDKLSPDRSRELYSAQRARCSLRARHADPEFRPTGGLELLLRRQATTSLLQRSCRQAHNKCHLLDPYNELRKAQILY